MQSVIKQSYPNLEYIVIDGGSTDGTIELLQKYDAEIAYWISESDGGIYDAFNKGIAHATGDYVQFLGSDDIFCNENTIRDAVAFIDDSVDILSCAVWGVDEDQQLQKRYSSMFAKDREKFHGEMIPHPGMFTRRELLLKHPFDTSYRIAADYLFFLTCYYDSSVKFRFCDEPVVYFSLDGVSSRDKHLLDQENQRVWATFGIPGLPITNRRRERFKEMLRFLHVFEPMQYCLNRYIRRTWQPHHCDWSFCRWCHPQT